MSDTIVDQPVLVEEKEGVEKHVMEQDEFAYLKKGDFSSEMFKIELRQISKQMHFGAFKKFLSKFPIKVKKLKLMPAQRGDNSSHAYVTLESEEERTKAIELLNGHKLKGRELVAKPADPSPDPLVKRLRENQEHRQDNNSKKVKADNFGEDRDFEFLTEEEREKKLNTQVAALWKMPYDEQLMVKHQNLVKVLKKVFHELLKVVRKVPEHTITESIDWFAQKNLEPVIASPITVGYRNKCEFNIDARGTIGFRLGAYKDGSVQVVAPPASCPIISPGMFRIVAIFQKYLQEVTSLKAFDPITREGHWRQMLVRSTRSDNFLISIAWHKQELTTEDVFKEAEAIKEFFRNSVDDFENKISLYHQVVEDRSSRLDIVEPRLISGPTHIFEHLLGVQFRISTLSFFQVNAVAAELLYEKIIEMATVEKKSSVVLDICCGTGTIGLCLAAKDSVARKVVGIELNEDAIKDAEFNREHNKIEGVTFRCGKAEVETGKVLDALPYVEGEDVVAIIDPPRSGLPPALIKTIRNNSRITRVVYVACDAGAAKQNFIDLCRPRSKAYHGLPFVPRRGVPVDLFPHTEGCELVLLFERQKAGDKKEAKKIDVDIKSEPSTEGEMQTGEI